MKVKHTKQLKIVLKGKDVEHFKTALGKLAKGSNKVGFNSSNLTEDEEKVLKDISTKLT